MKKLLSITLAVGFLSTAALANFASLNNDVVIEMSHEKEGKKCKKKNCKKTSCTKAEKAACKKGDSKKACCKKKAAAEKKK